MEADSVRFGDFHCRNYKPLGTEVPGLTVLSASRNVPCPAEAYELVGVFAQHSHETAHLSGGFLCTSEEVKS